MPDLTIYHLTPGGAIHIGQRGIGLEETGSHIPSDTFFAAMLYTWVTAGNKQGDILACFPEYDKDDKEIAPPFLLTSIFPRAGNLRFYPVPPLDLLLSPDTLDKLGKDGQLKKIKKIQYISEGLFKKVTDGEWLDKWLPPDNLTDMDSGLYLQGGALWLMADEVEKLGEVKCEIERKIAEQNKKQRKTNTENTEVRFYKALRRFKVWQVDKVPRVTVDRITNASTIYHTGRLTFNDNCGLWFGIDWKEPGRKIGNDNQTIKEAMIQSLAMMADAGIGGERSVGYGHFKYEEAGNVKLPDPEPDELFITLSRYHPRKEELTAAIADNRVSYKLVSVGGWLNSTQGVSQRRRRLWLMAEGSVLKAVVGKKNWGDIVDVRPKYDNGETFPHAISRYGLACPVGLANKGDNSQ